MNKLSTRVKKSLAAAASGAVLAAGLVASPIGTPAAEAVSKCYTDSASVSYKVGLRVSVYIRSNCPYTITYQYGIFSYGSGSDRGTRITIEPGKTKFATSVSLWDWVRYRYRAEVVAPTL